MGLATFFLAIFLYFHGGINFGEAQPSSVNSTEIDRLIVRIERRYARMRGLAADFEQTYHAAGGIERHESGRLILQRPGRMRWEYDPKPGKLFIVNGNDVWFYVPADREAGHGNLRSTSDPRFPFLFLLGQTNLRREFRSIEMIAEDNSDRSYRLLRMIPRARIWEVREMILRASLDGEVTGLKLMDEAGYTSEVSLKNIRENFRAPANAFIFHPPPGVTVRLQK